MGLTQNVTSSTVAAAKALPQLSENSYNNIQLYSLCRIFNIILTSVEESLRGLYYIEKLVTLKNRTPKKTVFCFKVISINIAQSTDPDPKPNPDHNSKFNPDSNSDSNTDSNPK